MAETSTETAGFCQSLGVRIVTIHRPNANGPDRQWPEGVTPLAVERCLAVIEARDPLTLPADRLAVANAPVLALALSEGGDASGPEIHGVAWRLGTAEGPQVDVRVKPGLRRRGLGRALLSVVADARESVWAGCDAAHPRVRRFLAHQGFELAGIVFHQRWDGELADVPPAFASATVVEPSDTEMVESLVRKASADTWPRQEVWADESEDGFRRIAWRGEQPAGGLLAHREHDAWAVDALAVLPESRGAGLGRALAVQLMRHAAASGLGVTLRVAQDNATALSWSQKLGFWTYRTWAMYRKPAPGGS